MDLNKVMVIGNIVRDPEMRTTPNGRNVTSFSIATNRVWKDANDQKQTKAEFHNIVAWGRLAEITSQYLKKGAKTYLEGRLETRTWDDPNGIKRYKTEIIADNMIMLDRAGAPTGGGEGSQPSPASDYSQPEPSAPADSPKPASGGEEEISIEDIPF
jgi:single-strand DNA-binding protein